MNENEKFNLPCPDPEGCKHFIDAMKNKLREKPEPTEFLKECRALRLKGATEEQWEYAEKLGQACIYIDQLQAKLEQRWIPVSEIPKNDSYHIVTDGSKCEWLYFNETWFYAENKKPYPRFFMLKFYWPISLPEQPPIGNR